MTVLELIEELQGNNKIQGQDEIMAMSGQIIILPKGDTIRKEITIDVRRNINDYIDKRMK